MAEPASGEESKSDSDATDGELHRTCRICYSAEFQDGMGAFLRPTPCNCAGNRSAVHETCLRRWQTIARRNRQWAAGAVCHACDSPYTVNLVEAGEKQPVAILGGTGLVGRALAAALTAHPIYCLGPVLGSPQTVGSKLADVWRKKEQALEDHYGSAIWQAKPCPSSLDGVRVSSVEDLLSSNVKYVISCIAPSLGHIEDALQEAGIAVFSISPHARQVQRNPLVVPEVNGDALLHALSKSVEDDDETIPLVKSPNCVSCGVSVVLKALDDAYGVVGVSITTFQALSGRGDAKYDPELVVGNVYPLRNTVERTDEYQRKELMRIFPLLKRCAVSAHRVPVQSGHFVDLKLQTKRPVTTKAEVKKILRDFAPLAGLGLPSMPDRPIVVLDEVGRPRPKLDSDYEGGMAVCVGNVHTNDGFFDVTLSLCVNNVVRGAWGAALLNLELYDLHVRPLVARISAKQKQLGGTARDAVREASAFLQEKVRKKPSPHWDVLLRWASSIDSASSLRERSDSEIQRFGVGPWEDESPTCIDTAIKRPPAPPDASS
jgi:aspartate-semialdehyde dehydrogenase